MERNPHSFLPSSIPRVALMVTAGLGLLTLIGMAPGINAAHIQYAVAFVTLISVGIRVFTGPDQKVYGATFVALLIFFFWQLFVYFFIPDQRFLILTISPIMIYGSTIVCLEMVLHVKWRTTLMNISSAFVLLGAIMFVLLWEGEAFRSTFMFTTIYSLLVVWIFGKALEIQPWLPTTPKGVRAIDIGFIFIVIGVAVYTMAHTAPNSELYLFLASIQFADHVSNIGLSIVAFAALSKWLIHTSRDTAEGYGFSQDITVAFVPLILGISGTSITSTISQSVLGFAALISTALLLIEVDNLHKELNVTNQQVRMVANTDRITNVPNRYALKDLIHDDLVSVTVIDVVGLDHVNTTYGYPIGDRLLFEFAQRLQARVIDKGHIIRSSGNEFIILWNQVVFDIDSRLRSTVAIPYEIMNERLYLGMEIGHIDRGSRTPEETVQDAYQAKLDVSVAL